MEAEIESMDHHDNDFVVPVRDSIMSQQPVQDPELPPKELHVEHTIHKAAIDTQHEAAMDMQQEAAIDTQHHASTTQGHGPCVSPSAAPELSPKEVQYPHKTTHAAIDSQQEAAVSTQHQGPTKQHQALSSTHQEASSSKNTNIGKDKKTDIGMMASQIHILTSHSKDVNCCSFSGNLLATCSGDKTVRLWDAKSFEELPFSPLLGHSYYVHWCALSAFGTRLATCSTDGKIIVWDTSNGETVTVFEHANKPILRVCVFSPDSQFLLSGGADNELWMWDLNKKTCTRKFEGHISVITACAFTPDGAHVVSGSTAGDLRVWDALNGQSRCLFYDPDCHDLALTGLAISPTFGSANAAVRESLGARTFYMLATCGDNLVRLWDLDTVPVCSTRLRCDLKGHSATVQALAFSADGRLLASGAVDKLAILWNPIIGEMLYTLEGHARYVTTVAFSHDNMFLATGSHNKIHVWKLGFNQPMQPADSSATTSTPAVSSANQQSSNTETCLSLAHNVISDWTIDAVCEWLQSIELEQYCETFRENHIDGQELQNLTADVLSKDLSVKALGHRQKILRGIQAVREKGFFSGSQGPVPDDQIPDEYLCPISREIMREPVIAADGYTYERSAIENWLRAGRNTSPMTNAPLSTINLTPNRSLKMIITRIYDV